MHIFHQRFFYLAIVNEKKQKIKPTLPIITVVRKNKEVCVFVLVEGTCELELSSSKYPTIGLENSKDQSLVHI